MDRIANKPDKETGDTTRHDTTDISDKEGKRERGKQKCSSDGKQTQRGSGKRDIVHNVTQVYAYTQKVTYYLQSRVALSEAPAVGAAAPPEAEAVVDGPTIGQTFSLLPLLSVLGNGTDDTVDDG